MGEVSLKRTHPSGNRHLDPPVQHHSLPPRPLETEGGMGDEYASSDRIRDTSPETHVSEDLGWSIYERTSHERHWIIVSRSDFASYGLPQRQNLPSKF